MRITITKHFRERVKERYWHIDGEDQVEKMVKRFKEVIKKASKHKGSQSVKIYSREDGSYKILDTNMMFVYAKKKGAYILITFGSRSKIGNSELTENLKKIKIGKK